MSCCGGNCAGCPGGGCSVFAGKGGAITLHPAEIDILRELAVCPFLPVGLNSRTGEPFCLEFPDMDEKIVPLALSVLEKRGFIRIDYDIPLAGFAYEGYEVCFRRGNTPSVSAVVWVCRWATAFTFARRTWKRIP